MSKVALERAGRFSKEIFAEKFFAAREEKESNTVNYTIEKKED